MPLRSASFLRKYPIYKLPPSFSNNKLMRDEKFAGVSDQVCMPHFATEEDTHRLPCFCFVLDLVIICTRQYRNKTGSVQSPISVAQNCRLIKRPARRKTVRANAFPASASRSFASMDLPVQLGTGRESTL